MTLRDNWTSWYRSRPFTKYSFLSYNFLTENDLTVAILILLQTML